MISLFFYVMRFGWPYLSKYKTRLFAGVFFGMLFGMSNASFPLAINILAKRLDPAYATSALNTASSQPWLGRITSAASQWADTWLPLVGRPMDAPQIIGCLLLLPGLLLIRGILGYLNGYLLKWVSERVINDLKFDVTRKLHTLSLDFFHRAKSGDLLTRINGDTKDLYSALNFGVSELVKEPITILSTLIVLLALDWQLTLFVLACIPLTVLPISLLGKKVRAAGTGSIQADVKQATNLVEIFHNIRVIKAFSLEPQHEERFLRLSKKRFQHNMRANRATELVNPIIELGSAVAISAVVLFVFATGRSIPSLASFLVSIGLFFSPVKKLTQLGLRFQRARHGIERIQGTFSETPSVVDPPTPLPWTATRPHLEFHIRSFGYDSTPVLHDIHFAVPHGSHIGLAGSSGSGKSSLINLILRFYDVTDGSIDIDGTDIRRFSLRDLRAQMALVSQDILLFDGTVAENITLGKIDALPEEIEAAARAAHAHEFICSLPDGYATQVGEKAVRLSGGQKQRLSIARAFIRNAPILLLDEATAALDSHSEAEVQRAIDELSENRTVFCVAHRLATLRGCDRIFLLEHGRIIEDGTFPELLQRDGKFAAMARSQGMRGDSV
jgi:subfamily B ATP-binding cassette protein MsbA